MNILEIEKTKAGTQVDFLALVSDKRTGHKKDGSTYLIILIQDNSGSLSFPLWDNFDNYNELIEVNKIIHIKGIVSSFNNSAQIRNPRIKKYDGDIVYSDFIPFYEIPKELIDYFIKIVNNLDENYKKIAIAATGAMGYNEKRWEAFIGCVAAEKFHGNKRGGLFLHTVGVMKSIESILDNYINAPFYMDASNAINKDRLMLKAIIHDIMKIKEYDFEGIIRRKGLKLDHLVMGAAYASEINKEVGNIISDEEMDDICYSILCHHGEYGNYELKGIEDILLNAADIIDSQIVNAVENKI
jgi:3'-5' exoribonuclease